MMAKMTLNSDQVWRAVQDYVLKHYDVKKIISGRFLDDNGMQVEFEVKEKKNE